MVRMHLPHRLSSNRNSAGQQSLQDAAPSAAGSSAGPTSDKPTTPSSGNLILKIKVIKGRNLAAKDKGGSSDPYLVLTLGDSRDSTVSISKSLNPEWNETIELPVAGLHTLLLEVVCWDKDRFGKDYMGEFDVALEDIFASGLVAQEPAWYALESRKRGRKKSKVTGEVLLAFSLHDPLQPSATPQQLQQRLLGLAATSSETDEEDEAQVDGAGPRDIGETDLDDDDEDEDEVEPSSESSNEREDPNKPETQEKRKRRLKLKRLRRRATRRAFEFSGLSDLAGVLFLEISRIVDLPPEKNMTKTSFDMDPFVVSSLGKKTYKTRVIRHNLNPVYDEKLVFQVLRHEQNYSLNFAIVDRDKLSGNDFIGTANFPIETISAMAPEADPYTGLYSVKEPEVFGPPMSESRRSRFRLPLSRSSSAQSIPRLASASKSSSVTSHPTQSSQEPSLSQTTPLTQEPPSLPTTAPPTPGLSLMDSGPNDDPELKSFQLLINLKNKERWEGKHYPTLYIKAKYLPYRALRQQFWRLMLRQYDADDNGILSKVELTTMLDSLGSTLHESTIDSFFERFGNQDSSGELSLTVDEAVRCLEDLLQSFEEQRKSWKPLKHVHSPSRSPKMTRAELSSSGAPVVPTAPAATEVLNGSSQPAAAAGEARQVSPVEGPVSMDPNGLGDDQEEEHVVEIRECPICHLPRMKKRSDADIITHIATCASQDWRQVNNIVMAGFVTSSQAQRKWYSKVVTKIGYGGYRLGANSANILVQDRLTGQISEERMSVYVRLGIRLLYKGLKSRDMEKKRIRKLLRSMSYKQGRKFDDPGSAAQIEGFVNFHQLDMSEVLHPTERFKNFNEFFYRELKPGARPCSAPDRPEIITSPADCRSVVFNTITEAQTIWVKGREFSVERLLGNAYPQDAKRYTNGGSMGIFRLAPQDYHRFHIPVDGVMGEPKLIEGEYYTVNPMAIRSALDVYGENIRVIVPIDSVMHGRVMVICVGAMMVGSTVITRKTGEKVSRAEELGYFKFGGSTLLVLFEPGMMQWDPDLRDNSNTALETLIYVGMSIGHSLHHAPHTPDLRKSDKDITREEKRDAQRRIEGSTAPKRDQLPDSEYGSLGLDEVAKVE